MSQQLIDLVEQSSLKAGQDVPQFEVGDTVDVQIEGLGTLSNQVVAPGSAAATGE